MWEVCVVSSPPAVFLLFILVILVSVFFSFQSCRKKVVSGWTYLHLVPVLIRNILWNTPHPES